MRTDGSELELGTLPENRIDAAFQAVIEALKTEAEILESSNIVVLNKKVGWMTTDDDLAFTSITGFENVETKILITDGIGDVDYSNVANAGAIGLIKKVNNLTVAIIFNASITSTLNLLIMDWVERDMPGASIIAAIDAEIGTSWRGSGVLVPNAPTALVATSVSATQINTVWVAPASGDAPTSYRIDRNLNSAGFTTLAADTGNTNVTYNDTTLSTGDVAEYQIYGINATGTGAGSNTSEATAWSVPSVPQNVSAILSGDDVIVSWGVPSNDGGTTITTYTVYKQTDGGAWDGGTADSASPYTDVAPVDGLQNYKVTATNSIGESTDSNEDSVDVGATITAVWATHSYSNPSVNRIDGYGTSLPSDYGSNIRDYPCIFFFHGQGQYGTNPENLRNDGMLETDIMLDHYAQQGFLVIAPQSNTLDWENTTMINIFIADMMQTYRINPNKTHWTGLSSGANVLLKMALGAEYTDECAPQPASVVFIAGGMGAVNGSFDMHSGFWFFRRNADTIAVDMDENAIWAQSDINPQEVIFTQFLSSSHGGWDYVYRVGTGESTGSETMDTTDPIVANTGSIPNTTFPGSNAKANIYAWMQTMFRDGDASVPSITASDGGGDTASTLDLTINTDVLGTVYIKDYASGTAEPAKLDIFVSPNAEESVTVGDNTVTLTGLDAVTEYDFYGFVEGANGGRSATFKVTATSGGASGEIRRANVNVSIFGGTISDPAWNNGTNNKAADTYFIENMNDANGDATTWDIYNISGFVSGVSGGTSVEDAEMSIPTGTTVRYGGTGSNGNEKTFQFEGLDSTKKYKVLLYCYHSTLNIAFTGKLGTNADVHQAIGADTTGTMDLGNAIAPDGSGVLTWSLTSDIGQFYGVFVGLTLIEEY